MVEVCFWILNGFLSLSFFFSPNLNEPRFEILDRSERAELLGQVLGYSGVTHKSLIFGFGLRHIRVLHLI